MKFTALLSLADVEDFRPERPAATLGVATLSYAPYAVFDFASPLLAILVATLGLRTLRLRKSRTAA